MNFGQIESHAAQAFQSFSGQSPDNRRKNELKYGAENAGEAPRSHAMSAFAYFRQADTNGDGLISPQEFSAGTGIDIGKLNAGVFGALDFDGQDGVSIHEAGTAMMVMDLLDDHKTVDGNITATGRGEFETFLANAGGRSQLTSNLRLANEEGRLEEQYQHYLQGLQETVGPKVTGEGSTDAVSGEHLSGNWDTARTQRRERAGVDTLSDEIAKTMQDSRQPAATEQPEGTEKPEGETPDEKKPETYSVRFGDTYWNIAEAIRKNHGLEASQDDVINALREQVGDADTQLQVGRQVNVDGIVGKFRPQTEETPAGETGTAGETANTETSEAFRQHLVQNFTEIAGQKGFKDTINLAEFNGALDSFIESRAAQGEHLQFTRQQRYQVWNNLVKNFDNSGIDGNISIQDLINDPEAARGHIEALNFRQQNANAGALATELHGRLATPEGFNQYAADRENLTLPEFTKFVQDYAEEKGVTLNPNATFYNSYWALKGLYGNDGNRFSFLDVQQREKFIEHLTKMFQ